MSVFESKLWIYACMSFLLVFDTCFATMDNIHIHNMSDLKTRKLLHQQQQGSCSTTGNAIDDCWRCDKKWHKRRKRLAECAIGFGKYAKGGVDGRYYIVTDSSDDDPVNPKKGTLRYAVIRNEPLWIFFKGDMVVTLSQELIMNSFKTIDGRGASVHIAKGAGITIQYISNVIIHGVHIYDIKQTGNAMVRSSPSHYGLRGLADGDAISIFGSRHIWIDHNSFSSCADGIVDVIMGSTGVTISNNLFTYQNEVMLLGHSDAYTKDKEMQVTIAYNRFGEGLTQRMPHCRHGYFHVMNNDYTSGWGIYAIGGAANPTIYSQGNRFYADSKKYPHTKEVTKRMSRDESEWKKWSWSSDGDLFLNGAFFVTSGQANSKFLGYAKARKSSMVKAITSHAGALICRRGYKCSKMLRH